MFIARISRGLTVREFLICELLLPSAVSVLWMTAFGGTAISMVADGANEISNAALELKLFMMLDQLPLANITSFITIILVLVFL
ncbi:MAG: BCCT family betaine/carnitine transporter [Methylophagaceae bacterium]|jgi:BCCT family betaine/carnitine transporter